MLVPMSTRVDGLFRVTCFFLLAGDPKGVLLKHSAVVATVSSLIAFVKEVADEEIGVGDSILSYLPLAHIFDRCVYRACLVTEEQACFGTPMTTAQRLRDRLRVEAAYSI